MPGPCRDSRPTFSLVCNHKPESGRAFRGPLLFPLFQGGYTTSGIEVHTSIRIFYKWLKPLYNTSFFLLSAYWESDFPFDENHQIHITSFLLFVYVDY
jgi:hypothetical protein